MKSIRDCQRRAPFSRLLSLSLLSFLMLAGWQEMHAQASRGYRITDTHITIDSPEHWRNWQLPTHAVNVTPEVGVRPHFFRNRYNLFDELDTFTRPLTGFRRREGQTAILNVDSTEARDVKGNILTQRVGGQEVPIYTYFLRPGISRVGSNSRDAKHILDGDPYTYWEPDPEDPLDKWWIEVDLGRVVAVEEIVLRFVDEELGDPFWKFRILVAPNQNPIEEMGDQIAFSVVGGFSGTGGAIPVGGAVAGSKPAVQPQDQQVFSFALDEFMGDPNWTGRLVQTFRIVVTDTRAGRGHRISEDEWQALDPSDRGDVVYYVRDQQGIEERLEQERLREPVETFYANLPPERQGRRDHFLRERPRLANIEVWGYGDNISPGIAAGGGSIDLTGGNFSAGPAFDGDYTTHFLHLVWSPLTDRGIVTVDMGATFFLDAMRIVTGGRRSYIDGYIMRGSDGTRDASGRLMWRRISPVEREDNSVDRYTRLQDFYDGLKLRFVEMTVVSVDPARRGGYNTGPDIAEYQLFSKGYPAEVMLTSDLIELPNVVNFGGISWEAEIPPGTNLEIRTRSGDLLGRTIRYFDRSGTEITAVAWSGLLSSWRGPVDTTFVPTGGWSSWSRPYLKSGDRVTSPGLRRSMQIQVKMTTTDRQAAASIGAIEIELLRPVAEHILAELRPGRVKAAGRVDTFEVFIQPNFIENPIGSRSLGFDELLLSMPSSQSMHLLELGLGVDHTTGIAEQVFRPSGMPGLLVAENHDQVQVLRDQGDSIWVRLPAALNILSDVPRVYHRITVEGDPVPVTQDGLEITEAVYGMLDAEERGDVRYFRQDLDIQGKMRLTEVSLSVYRELEEESKGPVRHFRILRGDGAQFPFDASGDSLDANAYGRLPSASRGIVVGPGPLICLRFSASVFVNGTTLDVVVRNTSGGTAAEAAWQGVEPGDVTPLATSNSLSINVPFEGSVIDDFTIDPNPFTPNGDGINDVTEIGFSVFKITSPRQIRVRIYTLDGRLVWKDIQTSESGRKTVRWTGVDENNRVVPPGLYICQVEVDTDAERRSAIRSRLIAVVY